MVPACLPQGNSTHTFDRVYPTGGYADFLYALKLNLDSTGYWYGMSCTLPLDPFLQTQFDIDRLQHTVDWFNVMTYDIDVSICTDNRSPQLSLMLTP